MNLQKEALREPKAFTDNEIDNANLNLNLLPKDDCEEAEEEEELDSEEIERRETLAKLHRQMAD